MSEISRVSLNPFTVVGKRSCHISIFRPAFELHVLRVDLHRGS